LLGEAAFTADGETAEEAIQSLEALRRDLYEDIIASGQPVPMPEDLTEEKSLPSGKWVVRTSPRFHAEARGSGLSFNTYCSHALERGHAASSMYRVSKEAIQAITEEIVSRAVQVVSAKPRRLPSANKKTAKASL